MVNHLPAPIVEQFLSKIGGKQPGITKILAVKTMKLK
jgi:hypothetical protein